MKPLGHNNSSAFEPLIAGVNGIPSVSQITNPSLNGGFLSFSATNSSAGGLWTLLQSANLTLPPNQWQSNMSGTFDANGNLSTTRANAATNLQEFYILKVQ